MPLPTIPSGNVFSSLPTGYDVDNSCRFNDDDDPRLSRASGTPTSTRKFTISFWVKKSGQVADQFLVSSFTDANNRMAVSFDTNDRLECNCHVSGSIIIRRNPTRKFRDYSAWYHIVFAVDTTQSTASDRAKVYVNGELQTVFENTTDPSLNADANVSGDHFIGAYDNGGTPALFFDGYLAEVFFVDGSQLAATSFGEFDEDSPTIWKPKDVSGLTFGTNGFYLDFEDSGDLGDDESGNTNDFTETNLAAVDQATDTPTNNFATMNPLDNYIQNQTFAEGNLQTLSDNPSPATSTIGMTAGKWWIEAKAVSTSGSGSDYQIGIISNQVIATEDLGHYSNNYAYYYDGNSKTGNSSSSYGDSYTHGDIIGIAVNLDDNELKFYKNGTVQNSGTAISITAPASTSLGAYFFALGADANANKYTWYINFGNPIWSLSSAVADENGYGSFEYAPPSGFLALCTKNLGSDGG